MIELKLKSGREINLTNEQVEKILKENIESIVEENLSNCTCIFTEDRSSCYCDGGLKDDDYIIRFISVVYAVGEDGK